MPADGGQTALGEELGRLAAEIEAAGASGVAELADELADATPESLAAIRAAEAEKLEARRSELERTSGGLREKLDGAGGDGAALSAEQQIPVPIAALTRCRGYNGITYKPL